MRIIIAAAVAAMFASATYLVLRRNAVKVVWGILLFSQGTNLYLLSSGELTGYAPVNQGIHTSFSDPLPQALVLTSIVIGFGLTAVTLVLLGGCVVCISYRWPGFNSSYVGPFGGIIQTQRIT